MDQASLKIYIVILNWNNFNDTDKCISSLIAINDSRIRIVLVDNHSTDNSASLLKEKYTQIPVLISDSNKGYAGGMNLGIKYALNNLADYIILSNNDIIYPNNFLLPLLELIQKDHSIGIVSPKVLYSNDRQTIYCAGADFKLLRGAGVAAFQGKEANLYANEIREISLAEGSCFLAKKEVFEKAGLLSEVFFMYFEDLEFSDRVRKYFKIYYSPKSIIYHKGGAGSSWKNHSPLYYYYYTRNRYLYFKSYGYLVKVYILLYSLLVSMIKALTIRLKNLSDKNDGRDKERIKSLILGNTDGIKALFKI
ncbi:MAG: glycosyltransferase family 2 protein [Ignavibacteriaceae bacterium]